MKKTVLITGVSRGIGRAIAERFLREDYIVYGTYFGTYEDSVLKAFELEAKYGTDKVKLFGPYDFRDLMKVYELVEKLKNYTFDTIVTSAGMFSENDDFNDFNLQEFTNVMNCNFYTQMIICTELKDCVKEGGSIVLMASNDAYTGAFTSMSYTISKAAVISLKNCLCVNYGERNVRVNCVSPGAIDTDMNTPEQMIISPLFAPSKRAGQPVDVARVVYFLASEEASFVNGVDLCIDGGYGNVSILTKSEADSGLSKTLQEYILSKVE